MCSAYAWPRSVQGQGHNLRLNIVWLYFVSALYRLNPWWVLQIILHKCQLCWDDVQCLCLTKLGSMSRSEFKIKHCMTYQRSISLTTIKNNPLSHVAHGVFITFCDSWSLRFHLPLQNIWFHPVTYGDDMIAFLSESTRLVFSLLSYQFVCIPNSSNFTFVGEIIFIKQSF